MKNYDASCGKGRRGCCIIVPDNGIGDNGILILVSQPSDGGSPDRPIILVVAPEATGSDSETSG